MYELVLKVSDMQKTRKPARSCGGGSSFILLCAALVMLVLMTRKPPPKPITISRAERLLQPAAVAPAVPVPATADPLRPLATPPAVESAAQVATTAPQQQPQQPQQQQQQRQLRVRLIMLVLNVFPAWWPYLVESYRINHPSIELLVVHANVSRPHVSNGAHVRYEELPLGGLLSLFARQLGIEEAKVAAKFASGKGLSDLKPFYGKVFEQWLPEPLPPTGGGGLGGSGDGCCSHWGWVDWDLMLGDVLSVVPPSLLWAWEAVTFPGATLGFAWAGQLTVFRNSAATRELYRVTDNHLARGFKSYGDGQSGWEERDFLRDTLRKRPAMSIYFHMAAQMDHKAQWLTWIPFDNYWKDGKIWRCAALSGPAAAAARRAGRAPLLPPARWKRDVAAIVADPEGFYRSKDRVCIRWDLESSPWKCCPHSTGVAYSWRDGRLSAVEAPHPNATAALLAELLAAQRAAHAPMRLPGGYDTCHEGAAFHAGLVPVAGGAAAPRCGSGTWALIDEIGRFSGKLQLLDERCA